MLQEVQTKAEARIEELTAKLSEAKQALANTDEERVRLVSTIHQLHGAILGWQEARDSINSEFGTCLSRRKPMRNAELTSTSTSTSTATETSAEEACDGE